MEKDTVKCAIYTRFSSHAQRDESIEQQLKVCRDYAASKGFVVVREYADAALSGTTDKRPQFQKMVLESSKKAFSVVLVYAHDRFARNRYDAAMYKNRLKKNGVRVVAVTMPLDDTPESILIESMMEGYAEYYSKNLSRSVSRGMDDNAQKAKPNGPLSYGYKAEKGQIVIDPVGSKAVRMIFDDYDHGIQVAETIRKLAKQGFKTARGGPISRSTINRILTNERYIGIYIYKDTRIEDAIPAIIDKAQFERVQDKYKSRQNRHKKGRLNSMEFLLTGKLFCGNCGSKICGTSGTGKSGEKHYYYACSRKLHKGTGKCTKKHIRKEALERFVLDFVKTHVMTDENIHKIAADAFALLDAEYQDKSVLEASKIQLKEVAGKIDNILRAIEDGMYLPSMKDRLTDLEMEKQELECRIVSESMKKPEFTANHFEYFLQQFRDGSIEDPDFAAGMVESLIDSIYLFDGKEKDDPGKIVIAFNLIDSPAVTLQGSDVINLVDQMTHSANPKPIYIGYNFAYVLPFDRCRSGRI